MKKVLILGGLDALSNSLSALLSEAGKLNVELQEKPFQWDGSPDVVVYAAASLNDDLWPNPEQDREHLSKLAEVGVPHVIVLSSSAVHNPKHTHPGLVGEVTPSRRGPVPLCDPWIRLEEVANAAFGGSGTRLTILRPAPTLIPGGRDFFSRLLTGTFAPTLPGHDPTIQLLAPQDLAGAIEAVIHEEADGLFNVAPRLAVPLRKAVGHAGSITVKLPRLFQKLARSLMAPLKLSTPPEFLAQLRYCFTVSGDKLAQRTGFRPTYSSAQAAALFAGKDAASAPDTDTYDDHGWEKGYTNAMRATLFGFLHNWFWRVENIGVENIPKQGRALAVGVHRGFMPFDGTMALYEMVRKLGRYPRTLIHPCLVKPAFQADYIRRIGGVIATAENADRLLEQEELVNIFPEGINGAFTYYKNAYKLGNFGRDAYVKMALRTGAPLIPFVTVGSAEIFPIIGRIDITWLKRYTEWPFLPVTSPAPLPSKWHTRYLEPITIAGKYRPEDAENPEIVAEIGALVKRRIEAAMSEMLAARKHIFFGNLWNENPPIEPQSSTPS